MMDADTATRIGMITRSAMTPLERARQILEAALPILRKDIPNQAVADLEQTAFIQLTEAIAEERAACSAVAHQVAINTQEPGAILIDLAIEERKGA